MDNPLDVMTAAAMFVDSDAIPLRKARAAVAELVEATQNLLAAASLNAAIGLKFSTRAPAIRAARAALAAFGESA